MRVTLPIWETGEKFLVRMRSAMIRRRQTVIKILVTLLARVGGVTSMMASASLTFWKVSTPSMPARGSSGSLLPRKFSSDLVVMMKVPLMCPLAA